MRLHFQWHLVIFNRKNFNIAFLSNRMPKSNKKIEYSFSLSKGEEEEVKMVLNFLATEQTLTPLEYINQIELRYMIIHCSTKLWAISKLLTSITLAKTKMNTEDAILSMDFTQLLTWISLWEVERGGVFCQNKSKERRCSGISTRTKIWVIKEFLEKEWKSRRATTKKMTLKSLPYGFLWSILDAKMFMEQERLPDWFVAFLILKLEKSNTC